MIAMKRRLKLALSRRQKQHIVDTGRVPAAVLLPIYRKQGEYYLVFTKRTEQMKAHKGQISFPGGAYQAGDGTLLDTALRECAEEIGLVADKVEILGSLDDVITLTSNFIIAPFVAVIPWPCEFKVSTKEIEEIIEAPISALLDRSCFHEKTEIINGESVASYSYHYQGRVVWGATAIILNQFLDIFARVMEDS